MPRMPHIWDKNFILKGKNVAAGPLPGVTSPDVTLLQQRLLWHLFLMQKEQMHQILLQFMQRQRVILL